MGNVFSRSKKMVVIKGVVIVFFYSRYFIGGFNAELQRQKTQQREVNEGGRDFMNKIWCLVFGHKWLTLWITERGQKCWRCGKLSKNYAKKPKSEWAKW